MLLLAAVLSAVYLLGMAPAGHNDFFFVNHNKLPRGLIQEVETPESEHNYESSASANITTLQDQVSFSNRSDDIRLEAGLSE